jgi:holo-[acyl-carrier protein] synthase
MTMSVPVLDGTAAGSLRELETRLAAGLEPGPSAPPIRVGIDVVAVAEVAESLDLLGQRYLGRVFSPHELACCRNAAVEGAYLAESLAARFAAKEAVVKVLRPADARPEWRTIEVRRAKEGWCEVRLTGSAAALAAEAGITDVAVSLTHERAVAAAVAVGSCRAGDDEGEE